MVGLNHDDAVPSSEQFLQLVRQWSVSDRPQCYTELTLVHLLHTPLHQTAQGWHVSSSCFSPQDCKSGGIPTIHPTGSICSQLLYHMKKATFLSVLLRSFSFRFYVNSKNDNNLGTSILLEHDHKLSYGMGQCYRQWSQFCPQGSLFHH